MDKDTLTLCAFRYCLGRMSYIASDVIDHFRRNWTDIHPNIQKIIKKNSETEITKEQAQALDEQKIKIRVRKNTIK